MKTEQIARVVHEANRALQIVQLEEHPTRIPVGPSWDDLDEETRRSAVEGVEGVLGGNNPEQSHEQWMQFKLDNGWKLGPAKDEAKKEHPLLVPYAELPESQRLKDHLFGAIVRVLAGKPGGGDTTWTEGYEWALGNLADPGVLADAHRLRCKAESGLPCSHLP